MQTPIPKFISKLCLQLKEDKILLPSNIEKNYINTLRALLQ